jgi:hypothetical protein
MSEWGRFHFGISGDLKSEGSAISRGISTPTLLREPLGGRRRYCPLQIGISHPVMALAYPSRGTRLIFHTHVVGGRKWQGLNGRMMSGGNLWRA